MHLYVGPVVFAIESQPLYRINHCAAKKQDRFIRGEKIYIHVVVSQAQFPPWSRFMLELRFFFFWSLYFAGP